MRKRRSLDAQVLYGLKSTRDTIATTAYLLYRLRITTFDLTQHDLLMCRREGEKNKFQYVRVRISGILEHVNKSESVDV